MTQAPSRAKGTVSIPQGKSEAVIQDEVIRRKLVVDGDGSGDDRRVQTFLKTALTLFGSDDFNPAEDTLSFSRVMQQLQQLEYTAKRIHAATLMNEESKKVYGTIKDAIVEETVRTKENIIEAKKVIEEETKHRKHSMEYEALSRLIESKPDRKATEERKRELEETLRKHKDLRRSLAEAMENRERQVRSLAFVIDALKSDIEGDDRKLWATGGVGGPASASSPMGMTETGPMDTEDSFPLEKEQFPLLSLLEGSGTPQLSQGEDTVQTPVSLSATSTPATVSKAKYDDLSEDSHEEGEESEG